MATEKAQRYWSPLGWEVLSPKKLWGSSSSPGSRVWSPLHCELQEGGCNWEPKAAVGEVIGWPQVIPCVIGPTRSCKRPGKASKPGPRPLTTCPML